jgi:sensor histidine kinase regulating citrate/malate metabolism
LERSESEKIISCLEAISCSLPVTKKPHCKNIAVSSVVHNIAEAAEKSGVRLDMELDIPIDAGRVSDMDLCAIVGSLMDNALEACERMSAQSATIRNAECIIKNAEFEDERSADVTPEGSERFIRTRTLIQGSLLSIVVENSFDGIWNEKSGKYYSRKRKNGGKGSREGAGIPSVRAICEKYDGRAAHRVEGNVWKASALVDMGI